MGHSGRRAGPEQAGAAGRLEASDFAARYEKAARTLWCIAAAIVPDRSLVEDVLQEAALVALEKLDAFDPDTNFTAWMGQIVRYVALNQARRAARSRVASVDPVILNHTTPSRDNPPGAYPLTGRGDVALDQESFDDDVVAALMSLDETARACLLMKTVLDLPYREIAAALGVPEGTAMSHVHRARGALRERLTTGDETRTSSA